MHFKLVLPFLVPMAMAIPFASSSLREESNVNSAIPGAVYDIEAWQAVVDEHLASKYFNPKIS